MYAYVEGDPINEVDSSGLVACLGSNIECPEDQYLASGVSGSSSASITGREMAQARGVRIPGAIPIPGVSPMSPSRRSSTPISRAESNEETDKQASHRIRVQIQGTALRNVLRRHGSGYTSDILGRNRPIRAMEAVVALDRLFDSLSRRDQNTASDAYYNAREKLIRMGDGGLGVWGPRVTAVQGVGPQRGSVIRVDIDVLTDNVNLVP